MFEIKKISVLVLMIILSLGLSSCKDWEYDIVKDGVHFKKIRRSETGNILGYMTDNHNIQGFPCEKGWIHFKKNGQVRLLQLSEDFMYKGTLLPAHSWYLLPYHEGVTGYTISFPYHYKVQGYLCRGSGGSKGIQTGFYENGKLRSFFLPEDVIVDGVPCEASIYVNVKLYKSGKIKSCKLAEEYQADGKTYKRGKFIEFDVNSKIK
ncbi:hypothetical protein ACFL6W_00920 [Thermodesulfobacteriota bacterium]